MALLGKGRRQKFKREIYYVKVGQLVFAALRVELGKLKISDHKATSRMKYWANPLSREQLTTIIGNTGLWLLNRSEHLIMSGPLCAIDLTRHL